MGCYIWYSEEGPGRAAAPPWPPRPLIARRGLAAALPGPSSLYQM